jgi:hypothetical protein
VLLHTDSIHISRLPRHLSAPEQQLALFAEQLTCHNPAAAAACLAVLGQQQDSTAAATAGAVGSLGTLHNSSSSIGSSNRGWAVTGTPLRQGERQPQQEKGQQQEGGVSAGQYGVFISACFTYRLPDASKRFSLQHLLSSPAAEHPSHSAAHSSFTQQQTDRAGNEPYHPHSHSHHHHQQQQHVAEGSAVTDEEDTDFLDWDADSAWHPWAQHRDPVHALELDIVWRDTLLTAAGGPAAAGGAAAAGDDGTASLPGTAAAAGSSILAAAGVGGRPALSPAGMASMVAEPAGADVWLLHVLQHGFSNAPARSGRLGVKGYERHRRHVRVEAAGGWELTIKGR